MTFTYAACSKCNQVNRISLESSDHKRPICGKCKAELNLEEGVNEVTAEGLSALREKSPLPVVVDFWAPWCGPCRAFAPTFKQTAREMAGRAVFAKVNTEANPMAASAHQIRSIPTLAVFRNGAERARQPGAMSQPMFVQWLNQTLS